MAARSGSALSLAAVTALTALLTAARAEAPTKQPLRIAATTQSLGNLEPCNCVQGMLGGFPRRLAALKRARKQGPLLVVDGGDLTGKAYHPRLLEAKTRAALELLHEVRVAAVAVGERDLRLGGAKLQALARSAGVTLLGANLTDAAKKRPFPAAAVAKAGGRTFYLIGLLAPELSDPSGALEVGDPVAAARAALAKAPAGATVVILFHGRAKAAAPLTRLPGVAGVICGHDQERATPLARTQGGAWRVEAVRDARSIAFVTLGAPPTLKRLPLGGDIPDDPFARARVERYYREVRGLPEPKRKPITAGGQYVGKDACMNCHGEAYEVFLKTKHCGSQARVIKKDKKRASLPECTACHVTGYGYEGGFVDMEKTPDLGEVSCEACHGVGGNHVNLGGGRGFGMRAKFPDSWKPVCLGCHDASNSPGFDFKKALNKIKHWKDRGR